MRGIYRQRDSAAKWILVTCFGFAGHKHAKFGLISAHAAVCAYGRENILRAKEVVERFDYRVLHIITDSVWIQKPRATEQELEAMLGEIERVTGLPIALEARYKWVAFLNSRVDARRAVPNRYFAAARDGEVKVRGIECRRHDTPPWIAAIQTQLVKLLAQANSQQELARLLPNALRLVEQQVERLRAGHVPMYQLTITSSLSRLPMTHHHAPRVTQATCVMMRHEYKVNNLNAAVARQLEAQGATLHLGERARYVVLDKESDVDADRVVPWDFSDGNDGYDAAFYETLLLRAVESVLAPCGITAQMLKDWVVKALPAPTLRKRLDAPKCSVYWGPLFELAAPLTLAQ